MKLAKREKLFISAAGGVLAIFLIFQLFVIPFFDKKNQLEKETGALERNIAEMKKVDTGGQGIAEIPGGPGKILSTRKESLLTFINREAEAIGLKRNNIKGMDPHEGKEQDGYKEDILEVQLDAITLSQLTEFLFRIEKPGDFIFINRATIRKNKKEEGYLDATVRVLSYKKENSEQ
jgi:type II secretory pathway component PulM